MSLTETVCGEKEGDEEEDDRWSVRGGVGWGGMIGQMQTTRTWSALSGVTFPWATLRRPREFAMSAKSMPPMLRHCRWWWPDGVRVA